MSDLSSRFWGGVTVWVIVALIGLIVAAGVISSHGRSDTDHWGPVPQGVARFSASDYLIYLNQTNVNPDDLCQGKDRSGDSIASTHRNGLEEFVQCAENQSWNVHTPKGVNFWEGLGRAGSSLVFIAVGLGFLVCCMVPTIFMILGDKRKQYRLRKQHKLTLEDKRTALAAAWAREEIDQKQFETKLDQLLRDPTA